MDQLKLGITIDLPQSLVDALNRIAAAIEAQSAVLGHLIEFPPAGGAKGPVNTHIPPSALAERSEAPAAAPPPVGAAAARAAETEIPPAGSAAFALRTHVPPSAPAGGSEAPAAASPPDVAAAARPRKRRSMSPEARERVRANLAKARQVLKEARTAEGHDEKVAQLLALHGEGLSLGQIAKRLKMSRATVWRHVSQAAETPPPPAAEPPPTHAHLEPVAVMPEPPASAPVPAPPAAAPAAPPPPAPAFRPSIPPRAPVQLSTSAVDATFATIRQKAGAWGLPFDRPDDLAAVNAKARRLGLPIFNLVKG